MSAVCEVHQNSSRKDHKGHELAYIQKLKGFSHVKIIF